MQKLIKGEILARATSKGWHDLDMMPTTSNLPLLQLSKTDYINRYKGWVFACVSTIASSVATLERVVKRNGKVVDNHPIFKHLTYDIIEGIVSYLKLVGSAYLWKVVVGKQVIGLNLLRPDRIKAVYNTANTAIEYYEYRNGTKSAKLLPEEVVMIKNFNPELGTSGYGDVQAGAISIDTDMASAVWNWKYFENDASAGTVLTTEQKLSPEALQRLESKRDEKHRGVNNSRRVAILHGGLKVENINPSQKEMDFVEQRRFSMDEILAIFKVPKAMLGMGEGVNVGNVKAFGNIFARNVLEPLAIKISEALSKGLLFDGSVIEFVNIVPADEAEIRADWMSGGISLNEFREARGYTPIKDGNRFFFDMGGSDTVPVVEDNATSDDNGKTFKGAEKLADAITKSILKSEPGTEEYYEEQRTTKNKRMETYEKEYSTQLKKVRAVQREDMLKLAEQNSKAYGAKALPKFDKNKYLTLYLTLIKWPQKKLVEAEGQVAMREVDPKLQFTVSTPAYKTWEGQNIRKFSSAIDLYTADKVSQIFKQAEEDNIGLQELKAQINNVFTDLSTNRLETIVRTETVKIGTYAQEEARDQSGVVEGKKWYTAIDDRRCSFCGEMHGKTIKLWGNFFDKGDTFTAGGQTVKLDYESIKGPPIHPKCRCTLIPIVKA